MNPIFMELLAEYTKQGKRLPWVYTDRLYNKVDHLPSYAVGMHPVFNQNYFAKICGDVS